MSKLATKLANKKVTQNNERSLANLKPFEKGVSGNPGGRPKLLTGAYKAALAEIDETTGKTKAETIADSLVETAKMKMLPHSVSAAKELRQATEGGDDGNKSIHFHFEGDMVEALSGLVPKKAEIIEEKG